MEGDRGGCRAKKGEGEGGGVKKWGSQHMRPVVEAVRSTVAGTTQTKNQFTNIVQQRRTVEEKMAWAVEGERGDGPCVLQLSVASGPRRGLPSCASSIKLLTCVVLCEEGRWGRGRAQCIVRARM